MRWCIWSLLLLTLLPVAVAAEADPHGLSFVETQDLELVYFNRLDYLVPHTVRTFTNALAWQRRIFNWGRSEPTTLFLKDFADYGSGAAGAAPHSRLLIEVGPKSRAFETYPASERMYSTMNHEMVHVATNNISNAEDERWRRIFLGKVFPQSEHPESMLYSFLTVPRYTAPRWYLEGAAVFMETWMDGGIGRAQGGYDEMVFRAMVRDGTRFYDPLGLVSRGVQVDFQVEANAYLYGTRFFTWLGYTYSPEKVVDWLKRDEGSRRYYSDSFRQVFGRSLEDAWQEWISFEHEFQQRNLAEVRRHPITPYRKLAGSAMGSISRMYYDEKSAVVYAAFRYPGFVEHVGALNTQDGSERRLADIKGARLYKVASFAYDPASETAFFTNNNTGYRDLMAVNVRTGEERMLLDGARIGEIAFNPVDRSLLGVRHANGLSHLVRIPYPYTQWELIHTFPYESDPYDLDISPDGRLLSASMNEITADQFVRVWDIERLLKGDVKPISEFRFGQSIPESFVFSHDGRYLYGSSYYTGVSNIYRYEVATGDVEAVSNAEIGFFRPVPLADGRLLVLAFTGEGFVPAIIEPRVLKDLSAITFLGAELAEKHPVVKTWQVPPPSGVDYEKEVVRQGPYNPARHVRLDNGFPVLQGYKNSVGIGYHLSASDPVSAVQLGMTVAYTPTGDLPGEERGHVEFTGDYLGWRARLSWNRSDFYDLFGPTKRSRKGYAAQIGYDDILYYEDPRRLMLSYDLEYFDQIDTLPNAQNIGTPFTRLLTAKVGLHYTDVRRSLGAVVDEKGLAWDLVITGNRVTDETPVQLRGNVDYGIALPFAHSSIWLRTAGGTSSGSRDNPVANFYFGSFGNNYVDNRSVQRYREYESMPGFGIDEISGQSFVRQMVEWNLPPVVFESLGTPALYLNWLRPSAFVTAMWTDPGNSSRRKDYQSLGAQLDLRISVLHWYDMTFSVGYAVGFQGSRRTGDEVMISLKIL